MRHRLSVCNDHSLAEQIQRRFPEARVVKALNTVGAPVMVEPGSVPGEHTVFVAGVDAGAKEQVVELLASMGWSRERVLDLGGIAASRGPEMYLPLWLSLFGRHGSEHSGSARRGARDRLTTARRARLASSRSAVVRHGRPP